MLRQQRTSHSAGKLQFATITFEGLARAQDSKIQFATAGQRRSDIAYQGSSVLDAVDNARVSVDGVVIRGQIELEGRPDTPHASWVTPLQVTLMKVGDEIPSYTFRVESDRNGFFTLPPVALGNYRMGIKGAHTLQRVVTVDATGASPTVKVDVLLEGDAASNDTVDVLDVSSLVSRFSMCQGEQWYADTADFNNDGCVNTLDFSLLAKNFGKVGEPLVPSKNVRADISRMVGEIAAKQQGERFTLAIKVDETETEQFDSAAFYLSFNPDDVRVLAVTPDAQFDNIVRNDVDNELGKLNLAVGRYV